MTSKRVHFIEEGNQRCSSNEKHKYIKRAKLNSGDDNDEIEINYEHSELIPENANESDHSTFKSKKHTLDSDEEDEIDNYGKLDLDKIEGQEDATMDYEGKIKIMPFNIKDDLEEGHFNEDGAFIYDKKQNMIKDAWLDNIEWDKVKEDAGRNWKKFHREKNIDISEQKESNIDVRSIYSRLLEILNGEDTIAGTLKKLNNEKGLSATEERKRRWAAKKAGINMSEDDVCSKKVIELTSLTDSLISLGQMEAYQYGSVKIKQLIADLEPKVMSNAKKATFDMFAE